MSINHQRINQLTASEMQMGTPVYTQDGKKLGKVDEVTETSLKVNAPMQRDYWLALTYVVTVQDDAVTMSFGSADLGAYKLGAPVADVDEEPVSGEILLSEEEQREQRERMARQLADQRRDLVHVHPDGEGTPPDTGGTLGEPVEAELERMESEGVDALDQQLADRGAATSETMIRDDVLAPPTFGVGSTARGNEHDRDGMQAGDIDETIVIGAIAAEPEAASANSWRGSDAYGTRPPSAGVTSPDAMQQARGQAIYATEQAAGAAASGRDARDYLALAQGAFFAAGGLWPLIHRRSFEAVTGPKTDFWLVKTVGLLLTATGGALMLAGVRKRGREPEAQALAVSSSAALGLVDYLYVRRGRISKVYLLDLAAQAAFVASWFAAPMLGRRRVEPSADNAPDATPQFGKYTPAGRDTDAASPSESSAHPVAPTR